VIAAIAENGEEITAEALLQRNDELSQYVNMLTEVLTEASGEITNLKERIATLEQELEDRGTNANLPTLAVPASQPASEPVASPPRLLAASPRVEDTASPSRGGEAAATVHALQTELHALRENYHQAMTVNDSLRDEIEELQSQLAAAEEAKAAMPRARSASAVVGNDTAIAATLTASTQVFTVLENERFFPVGGWSSQTLGSDWYAHTSR
jgi:DNA repair exonuclease SbcCD ATPase subunit